MHGVVDGDSIGEPCEGVDDVRGLMVLGQIGHFERVRAPVGPVQVSVEERQVVWVRDAHRQDCSAEMSICIVFNEVLIFRQIKTSTSNDVKILIQLYLLAPCMSTLSMSISSTSPK